MVEIEINIKMKNLFGKTIAFLVLLSVFGISAFSQEISWSRAKIDASRTGVVASDADNTEETMGKIIGKKYIAPNGRIFRKRNGVTYNVAKALLASQDKMRDVKKVIGRSVSSMPRKYPESELTNWFIDELMKACEAETGRKVDVGIANFGGVRMNMPKGNITLDDIMSMFPFRNNLCYVALKGRYIREIVEKMAKTEFQILGGIRCEAKGGRLMSMTIGDEPVDDEKIYGVCTISFLLDGGDNLRVAKNASEVIITDKYIFDAILPRVEATLDKPLEYKMDGRVRLYAEDGNIILPKKL